MGIPCGGRKRRSSACRVRLSSSIYACVCSPTDWGRWVEKRMVLECRQNGMSECRGNMGDERTEKKKNRSYLCLQTTCPSVLFDFWSSWFIRAEMTDVSFPWYVLAEMADVLSPWYTRAEMTRVSSPWYTRAEMADVSYCSWYICVEMITWDSGFMHGSMSGMIPCIEKPIVFPQMRPFNLASRLELEFIVTSIASCWSHTQSTYYSDEMSYWLPIWARSTIDRSVVSLASPPHNATPIHDCTGSSTLIQRHA